MALVVIQYLTYFYSLSAIASIIIYFASLTTFVADFRTRVLKLRKGDPEEKEAVKDLPLTMASKFVGCYIGNATFAYLIDIFAFGLLFTVLVYPLFWRALWESRAAIITVVVAAVIAKINKFVSEFYIETVVGKYRR